jgi:GNAT superfamily N-acetyltransferase
MHGGGGSEVMAAKEVFIRRFERADLDSILSLVHRTVDGSYARAYSDEARAFFKAYHDRASVLGDAEEGTVLVVVKAGIIVGTGTLRGNEVRRVFVDPTEQGKGIGRALMEELLAAARRAGLDRVVLDSSTVSKRFYERLGFTVTGDGRIDLEAGGRLDYQVMELRLVPT